MICVCCRFVTSWVDLYYHGDDAVQRDPELHGWLTDINTHGFSNGAFYDAKTWHAS